MNISAIVELEVLGEQAKKLFCIDGNVTIFWKVCGQIQKEGEDKKRQSSSYSSLWLFIEEAHNIHCSMNPVRQARIL
ncbi:MAG: hypothetical protein V8Q57_09705 [Blautia sp.]